MKLHRPTLSAVTALTLLLRATGLAHADPPQEPVHALPELPGISPPPQGRPPPAPHTGDTRPDGATLIAIGTLAIAGGVVLIVYGYQQGVSAIPCSYCSADLGAEVGGAALAAAGLAGVIVGIVVFANGSSAPAKAAAASGLVLPRMLPTTPERPDTAWLRTPEWRDSARDGATAPVREGVSLFAHSF